MNRATIIPDLGCLPWATKPHARTKIAARHDMRAKKLSGVGLVVPVLVALCVSSCGGGGGGGGNNGGGGGGGTIPPPGQTPPPNRAPVASNDVLRVDGATVATIAVLANDTDPDANPLTVTIEENAPIGVAAVNADGTVRITSLPGDFKGVTRFRYRVTDGGGLSSVASAAVFVGTDPFRVFFAGDASSNGSPEVYLQDFLSATPTAVTSATEGTLRLRGFLASENGATVVYRRADTGTPTTTDLSFVQTATPTQQVRIALPAGASLVQDAQGNDQYRVSPDGKWIALIARDGANVQAAYVLNVASPTTVSKVSIAGTAYATLPRFSSDSKSLYLLAAPTTNGANKALYTAELGTANVGLISAPNAVSSADDVLDYSVSPNQSSIILRANRGGRQGLYFVDASHLQTEVLVSHPLAITEALQESETTVGRTPAMGGSVLGTRVAYTTLNLLTYRTFVADISATPGPKAIGPGPLTSTHVVGLSPNDEYVLYSKGPEIYEARVDASSPDKLVSAGTAAWYDSTSNIVLVKQALPAGGSTYTGLAVTTRTSFGSSTPIGTSVLAATYFDVSGFDRAVVILGEGPTTGAAPTSARLALVNALAPDKLIYLADFQSPLQLSSHPSQIVSR